MDEDISGLTLMELIEKMAELENTYVEFFYSHADSKQLLQIRTRILEIKKEIQKREPKRN